MRLTKKQRDNQEREYADMQDAIQAQREQSYDDADAEAESAQAYHRRTHGGLFQDSYSD